MDFLRFIKREREKREKERERERETGEIEEWDWKNWLDISLRLEVKSRYELCA